MRRHRAAEAVLAAWREVERGLDAAARDSPEFEALALEAAALRDRYQRLVAEEDARPWWPEPESLAPENPGTSS